MTANINSMMFVGEKPWHKQGVELKSHATAKEALTFAGLDWKVSKEPVTFTDAHGVQSPTGHYAVVRSDTQESLGVVGERYRPAQNEILGSIGDDLVQGNFAMYETAGALGKGEAVWMLAKLPGFIKAAGNDVIEKYLLLVNKHDGTGSLMAMLTPIRVVCQNTMNVAIESSKKTSKIRHTLNMPTRIGDIREYLGLVNQSFNLFEEAAQALTKVQLTKETFEKLVKASGVVPNISDAYKASTRASNIMEEVTAMFEHGRGNDLPEIKGTAWAGLNAIVEYVDYARTSRGGDRTKSILFGSGANIKQAAFDSALALTK